MLRKLIGAIRHPTLKIRHPTSDLLNSDNRLKKFDIRLVKIRHPTLKSYIRVVKSDIRLVKIRHPTLKFDIRLVKIRHPTSDIAGSGQRGTSNGREIYNQGILDIRTHFMPTETFQYTYFSSCHLAEVRKGLKVKPETSKN